MLRYASSARWGSDDLDRRALAVLTMHSLGQAITLGVMGTTSDMVEVVLLAKEAECLRAVLWAIVTYYRCWYTMLGKYCLQGLNDAG